MMDERILQYLANELNNDEKLKFEDELSRSTNLKKEFDKYASLNSKFINNKKIAIDDSYFNGIVPEFRKRLEVKKKSKKIFAFSFANSLAAIIVFYLVLSPGNTTSLAEAVKNWTENDFKNAIEYAEPKLSVFSISNDNDYSTLDSLVSSMLSDELNLTSNIAALQVIDNSIDYKNLDALVGDSEADEIYNKILNKKYF